MFEIFLLILMAVFDVYAFQSIKTAMASSNDLLRNIVYTVYWSFCIVLPLLFLYGVFHYFKTGIIPGWSKLAGSFLIALSLTQLCIIIFLAGEDIYRLIENGYARITASNIGDTHVAGRRKFVSQTGLMLAAVPFFSFIYGITKGKFHYKVHKIILPLANLPKAFDGFKIVQISDIHSGSYRETEGVIKGIELINEQQADLFVFTGDLVNARSDEFFPYVDIFKTIKSKYGKFSILGNHDYGDYFRWNNHQDKIDNFELLKKLHSNTEFKLLLDEHVRIEKDGEFISLIGVQNWGRKFAQYGDLDKALEGIDNNSIKILLSHDPTHFDEKVIKNPSHIHLTLSGHTHGAQMGVEFPFLKWSPVQYLYPKWAGLYEEANRFLYVNRGFGFLGFEGRVGIWPEITVFELKSA